MSKNKLPLNAPCQDAPLQKMQFLFYSFLEGLIN